MLIIYLIIMKDSFLIEIIQKFFAQNAISKHLIMNKIIFINPQKI